MGESAHQKRVLETIIEISSDEEDDELQNEEIIPSKQQVLAILDEFLAKCKLNNVSDETCKRAREIFQQTRNEFVTQNRFVTCLEQHLKVINKENVKQHINAVVECLFKEDLESIEKVQKMQEIPSNNKVTKEEGTFEDASSMLNKIQSSVIESNNHENMNHTDEPTDKYDDDVIILDVKINGNICKSTEINKAENCTKKVICPMAKNENSHSVDERKQKRMKLIKDLNKRLEYYSKEIKKLQESEISLDEMDQADSSYLKECKLKEKFMNVHKKLCKLEGSQDPIDNVDLHKKIKIAGCPYPEINREAENFINKRKKIYFPDFFDIKNIVSKANSQYNIGLRPNEEVDCAREVFSEIGDKMQRRRKREFKKHSKSFLNDLPCFNDDPADNDAELRKKLKQNRKISKKNTDDIFRKYLYMQYEGCGSPMSSDDEEFSKKVIETQKKISPVAKRKKQKSKANSIDTNNISCKQTLVTEEMSDLTCIKSENDSIQYSPRHKKPCIKHEVAVPKYKRRVTFESNITPSEKETTNGPDHSQSISELLPAKPRQSEMQNASTNLATSKSANNNNAPLDTNDQNQATAVSLRPKHENPKCGSLEKICTIEMQDNSSNNRKNNSLHPKETNVTFIVIDSDED